MFSAFTIALLVAFAPPRKPVSPPPVPVPTEAQQRAREELEAKARALQAFEAEQAARRAVEAELAAQKEVSRRRGLRIAVNDLRSDGIDPLVVQVVADSLSAELRKHERVSVVSLEEIRAMLDLEGQRQLAGCSEESCLAEIAEALGVDVLVTGSLTKVGAQHVFGIVRIDQQQAKTVGQVSRRLTPAGGEEFLAAIGPAVEELFPELTLREGVTRGVAKEVALRLNPPPLHPTVFWTSAVLTGGAGIAAVATTTVNLLTFDQVQQRVASATPDAPVNGQALKVENDLIAQTFVASVVLGIVAGVGAATTGVVALFTDWGAE